MTDRLTEAQKIILRLAKKAPDFEALGLVSLTINATLWRRIEREARRALQSGGDE